MVAEFVAGSGGAQGLAWRILEASNRLQTDRMFAAILVLALMAVGACIWSSSSLERRGPQVVAGALNTAARSLPLTAR